MNLYLILEGDKTETLLYPKLINYILPNYSQIHLENQVNNNNFYIFSGGGIPSIYNHTVNAIKNINENPKFHRLLVCLDAEEIGVEARINEIKKFIKNSGVVLNDNCKIDYIIQNVCIETWFLGNSKIFKKIPSGKLLNVFKKFHDVSISDPEELQLFEGYKNKAHFHYAYFREILKEHDLKYSKSNPNVVLEQSYFKELENRVNSTSHLQTFKGLISILNEIKSIK